jgi:predicted class III extradiol MEMO1 family dioxygenase
MSNKTTRSASHAGTWYSARSKVLSGELDQWLSEVGDSVKPVDVTTGERRDAGEGWTTLPIPGARIIIAP